MAVVSVSAIKTSLLVSLSLSPLGPSIQWPVEIGTLMLHYHQANAVGIQLKTFRLVSVLHVQSLILFLGLKLGQPKIYIIIIVGCIYHI